MLGNFEELDLTYCDNIPDFSMLSKKVKY